MKPVIEVQNISKLFRINQGTAGSLREAMSGILKKQQIEKEKDTDISHIWALKDVNLEVKQGEILGMIGKNGSGKSTLLKILARIVTPTSGKAILRGRLASILEVGTGFHPELTGRENIFLNGAILGMKTREIEKCFDDIVEFAGTARFLDTPVKYYSSGMYVRLAFSVAAHLESDIMLVDEVLAVGDFEFQNKSLKRMQEVARDGRTVVFVSHSMSSVKQLCTGAVLLNKGVVVQTGPVDEVIANYENPAKGHKDSSEIELTEYGIKITNIKINSDGADPVVINAGEKIEITFDYTDAKPGRAMSVGYALRNGDNGLTAFTHNLLEDVPHRNNETGKCKATLFVPKIAPGLYSLELFVWINHDYSLTNYPIRHIKVAAYAPFKNKEIFSKFPSHLTIDSEWKFD